MIRTLVFCALAVVLYPGFGTAQSVRSLVNGGNDKYEDRKFADAEIDYRKALEQEHELVEGHFNLGNALYKQGKFDEAVRAYEAARQAARNAIPGRCFDGLVETFPACRERCRD